MTAGCKENSAEFSQGSVTPHGGAIAELMLRWVGDPLLLAHGGVVIAANQRASEVTRQPLSALTGLSLAAAIDLLYESADGQPAVEVHRLELDRQSYQLAVMPLAHDSALERSQRWLAMLGECVRHAQTAQNRAELLEGVCRSIATTGRFELAWVGVPEGEDGAIRAEVSAGAKLEYLDGLDLHVEDTSLAAGNEAVCVDFESGDYAPWRERAVRHGFASALSLPLKSERKADAALMIYAARRDAFQQETIDVLAQVAAIVELVLEAQRKRTLSKAVEQNAADWDEHFRDAFEHSLFGMLVFDLEGKVLDANAEFCNRLGYTRQEIVGMHLQHIVSPDQARQADEQLASIRTAGFAAFDTAYVCRDGSLHKVELSCRTYVYGDDQIVLGISRDTLDKPDAGSALRLALEASRTGLFDWDLGTNKVAYSSEWKAQLGYKDEEIGDDFGEWELRVHPDDAPALIAALTAYVAKPGDAFEAEFRMRHKTGGYRWILARGAILYGAAKTPERMLGSHVDITQRRRVEQQAVQAQKLETVARVAGGVAQDYERFVRLINGYSDLILPGLHESDPLKPRIEAIRDAGQRAAALNKRLLGLGSQGPSPPRPVDLNTIAADAESTLRRLVGQGVAVETKAAAGAAFVSADPGQITQLLLSLGMQAGEGLPEGGRIRVAIDTPISGTVRLTVSGSGAETEPQGNAGVELAIASGIVARHSGTITVRRDAGNGPAFEVRLPAAESPVRPTVRVMEPDDDLRVLICDMLDAAGYRAVAAGADRVDIVVADAAEIEALRAQFADATIVCRPDPLTTAGLAQAIAQARKS